MSIALLALLHAYIGARLLPVLSAHEAAVGVLALLALFLLTRSSMAGGFGRRRSSGWLMWAGLIALGMFSSLFVLTAARDVALLLFIAAGALGWRPLAGHDLEAISALAVPALAMFASAIGLFNARRLPAVREVELPIAGLPEALAGFAIVQISDLHVGATIRGPFVSAVVAAANRLRPDLIVVTGDMVDGSVAELREHTAPLGELRARHGVLAVTGNHEYYSGAAAWVEEFRRLGMKVLLNEHVVLRHGAAQLLVAGVADYSAHHFDPTHRSDPAQALHGAPHEAAPKVLLAHQPRSGCGSSRFRPSVVRAYPWRAVPALEFFRAPAATVYRWAAPTRPTAGLCEPRYRLLGPADAPGRAVGDHATLSGARGGVNGDMRGAASNMAASSLR